jgi:hypothetical protein
MTTLTLNLKMTTHLEPLSVAAQSKIKGGMATVDEEKKIKISYKLQ